MHIILFIFSLIFYLFFQSFSIYGGDAGDLATAAAVGGIAHPPGFPLYTFLGWLLTKTTIFSTAWRIGLLSSIPTAVSLAFLYLVLIKIYKKNIPVLIAIFSLVFSYIVWLYAEVIEVFGLNSFFAAVLIYLAISFYYEHKNKYLYLIFVVFGFAIAHHQFILFLSPVLIYFFYYFRKLIFKKSKKLIFLAPFLLFVGFLPYFYTYFSAKSIPMLSWNNPVNFINIFHLFSREAYGTFYSGASFGQSFHSRLIQIPAYFSFIINDFTIIGFLLIILGIINDIRNVILSKKHFQELFFLLGFIFTGPFFYFYGAYLITNEFQLGIYEKFLTLSYLFLPYYLCSGIILIVNATIRFLSVKFPKVNLNLINLSAPFLFMVIPLSLFIINYPKISILKTDFTAENLSNDILKTVDQNGILLLERDSPLFNTQYMLLVEKLRPDVKIFHYQKLFMQDNYDEFLKYHSELKFPRKEDSNFANNFINLNYNNFPIYSISILDTDPKLEYQWVRMGILYRLYKKGQYPKTDYIANMNKKYWSIYTDPLKGSLRKYRNLLLSNVLVFYEDGHRETAEIFIDAKKYKEALYHIDKAIEINPDNFENYFTQSRAYYYLNQCDKAKHSILKAQNVNPERLEYNKKLYFKLAEMEIYKSCYNDLKKADQIMKIYEKMKEKTEIQLKQVQ